MGRRSGGYMKPRIALFSFVLALQAAATSMAGQRAPEHSLTENKPATAPAGVSALPLHEVRGGAAGNTIGLLITGDGGWADLDQNVSAALAGRGIPIVALSSLKYFWYLRTPEQAANDVAQTLRHYLAAWGGTRIVLIGYSFGADVLPFIFNRLPDDLRARVVSVNLLGLGTDATFEVSVAEFVHASRESALAVRPEVARIGDVPVLCVYGEGEKDTLCPALTPDEARSVRIGSGHHFSGDYAALAGEISRFSSRF
jgi:type IV secretory pathway VirJ component